MSTSRHGSSLTPFPAPLPSLENRGGAEKSQASNHGLVFLVTSPHLEDIQESTKSFLIRIKDAPFTQEIPSYLGALCQEPGAETKYISYYDTPTESVSHSVVSNSFQPHRL